MGSGGHPQVKDRLRWIFLKIRIPGLILIFIAILALAAALLALILELDSARQGAGFLTVWKEESMELLSLPVKGPPANSGDGVAQGAALVGGLLAVILPALYIGAIVFGVFIHPTVFVFRRKIALLPTPETFKGELADDGHVLAIRVYNGSRMRALDIRFEAVHQHWYETAAGSVVRNVSLRLANPNWPMADQHVPYTLFVCLDDADVVTEDGHLKLRSIGGREVDPRDRLVIHVLGTMPDVGENFVEREAFDLSSAVTDEDYGGIQLLYGGDSKTWGGWDGFDR